jgi:FtsH-binding integral membrane protein
MAFRSFRQEVDAVPGAVSGAGVQARIDFIRRTYLHLAAAIIGFVLLEYLLVNSPTGAALTGWTVSGPYNWLIVLGAFMGAGWLADRWATSGASPQVQYLGLALYVLAEVILFCPLLYVAAYAAGDANLIPTAAIMTLMMFGGLTATVFMTKQDFSFMRGALSLASFAAFGVIVAGIVFGFSLGLFFSLAMVALASGYVLYYTSNVLHHYRSDQHVAASLALFAAIALLFYYVLRVLMSLRD